MYRCSVSYSFAEIVYRKALRRIGSAVDLAEILGGPFAWGSVEEDILIWALWGHKSGIVLLLLFCAVY